MARILVTGAAGFIGSHVVDAFIADGHDVVALDDLSRGSVGRLNPKAEFLKVDVRSLEAAHVVSSGRFDVIAHLAAQIDVRASVSDPQDDAATNVLGTLNLLEAVRTLPPTQRPRFVFASTGGALYGEVDAPPTAESRPKNPDAPYGIGKLSAELYMGYYGRVHDLDCVVLRFGNVYGPRQDPHGEAGVIAIFCGKLLQKAPLTIFGDGSQTRDYIFVDDVARAFVKVAESERRAPGPLDEKAFNIGTGKETSVVAIAHALAELTGMAAPIVYAQQRPGEIQRSVLDPLKARLELGWTARTDLVTGLAATWEWTLAARASGVI